MLLSLPVDEFGQRTETSLGARFEAVAGAVPDAPALLGAPGDMSYGELEQRTRRAAAAIVDHLGPGPAVVAIGMQHGPDAVLASLAVVRAGKVLLSIEPTSGAERMTAILADAEAALLLAESPRHSELAPVVPPGAPILGIDDLNGDPEAVLPERDPADPALLLTTSGTSGEPKNVVVSHRAQLYGLTALAEVVGIGPGGRSCALFSMAFTGGATMAHLPLLHGGAVWADNLRTSGMAGLIAGVKPSAQLPVSRLSVLRALSAAAQAEDLASVRTILAGGERFTPDDLRRARRVFPTGSFVHLLASTEASLVGFSRIEPDEEPVGDDLPLSAFSGGEVSVSDGSGGRLPVGEQGEIVVRGPFQPDGYLGHPDMQSRFTRHPDGTTSVQTGDYGWLDSDGRLHLSGRRDNQVQVRGQRVELDAVEAAINALPSVAAAAICAVDIHDATILTACIVASKDDEAPDAAALREQLASALPSAAIPTRVLPVPALPALESGKVDRGAVTEFVRSTLSSA